MPKAELGQSTASSSRKPSAQRWVRNSQTLWRYAGGTVIVLPNSEHRPAPLVISGSAALVWELLATPTTLEDLSSELARTYRTTSEAIATDLVPVLAELEASAAVQQTS